MMNLDGHLADGQRAEKPRHGDGKPPTRVVVVGATGNVGTALVRALVADPSVDQIVGVARRVPGLRLPGVEWHQADIATDPLDMLAGATTVVHLAWKIQPQREPKEMAETNVEGTRRVLDAVALHRVPSLVAASSVGAYSRGPKNRPVDETWPTQGVSSSVYSRHKAAVEALLDVFERDHPEVRVARLRTSLVMQRAAASEIHRIFLGPVMPWHLPRWLRLVPSTSRLVLQVTHADDIADAYRRVIRAEGRGAYNVAAEPPLTMETIARAVGGHRIPVPARVLRAIVALSYRMHLQRSEPGWIDMALDVPLMSCDRIRALGWSESRSSLDALLELLDGIGAGAGEATVPLEPRRRPHRVMA